jgi:hypothetical protein
MNFIILFFIVFMMCMCLFSIDEEGIDDIPSEFDCIPEIANMKYQKTYQSNLYLKYMVV